VESAIICLRLEGKENRWALAHVYRHPQVEQPPPAWRLSHVTDVKYVALRGFDHTPKNDEIETFLHDTWWKFTPDNGFKLLDGAMCETAWRAVTGQQPKKFYDSQPTKH